MKEKITAGPALSWVATGRDGEQARADDGADAERDQIHRAERALQLVRAALAFAQDAGDAVWLRKDSNCSCSVSFLRQRKINGHSQQYQNQPSHGEGGFVHQQQNLDHTGYQHIQGGQYRVAHGAVGAIQIRTRAAKSKKPADGQDIEQQNCKDNIVEQIVVLSASVSRMVQTHWIASAKTGVW